VVTANYGDGILTISVGLKTAQRASAEKIEVANSKKRPGRHEAGRAMQDAASAFRPGRWSSRPGELRP
jgi:hypothetical protein